MKAYRQERIGRVKAEYNKIHCTVNVLRSLIIVFLVLYLKEILFPFQIYVAQLMQTGRNEGRREAM